MRVRPALLGLILATATPSCAFLLDFDELQAGDGSGGGDAGGAAGSDAGIPLGEAVSALTTATCARIDRCRGALAFVSFGEEACEDFVQKSLEDGFLANLTALDSGGFAYHPELMPACIAAFAASPCDVPVHWPAACGAAFEGKVAAGSECSHSLQCPYDHICQGCPGKCTPAPKADEACADGICANGLYCDQSQSKCRAPAKSGGACAGGTAPRCSLDMTCVGAEQNVPGKCKLNSSLFTSTNQCNWLDTLCQEGFFCSLNSVDEITNKTYIGKCTGLAEPNQPCSLAIPDPCPAGYFCNGVGGFCTGLPKTGQACTISALKGLCAQGARCAERNENDPVVAPGNCVGLVRNGQNCAASEACYSNLCVDNKCKSAHSCL